MHFNQASAPHLADLWSLLRKNNHRFFRQRNLTHFKDTLATIAKHKNLSDLAQIMALSIYADAGQKKLIEAVCLPWLRNLPHDDIYKIDGLLRASINHVNWHAPSITNYSNKPQFFELFTLACHPDGYIREPAIIAIAQYPEPLALALTIIRCNDWVTPLRTSAKDSAITLIKTIDLNELVSIWGVLARSSLGQRHGSIDLTNSLLSLIYQRIPNDLLHRQLRSSNSRTRRYTAEVMWYNHRQLGYADLQSLCNCHDPFICFKTIRNILPRLGQATRRNLLASLKRKKWAPARLERLRLLIADNSNPMDAELINALCDRSPAVRNFARFYLKGHSNINIENHYKEQSNSQNIGLRIACLQGLHEISSPLSDHFSSKFIHEKNSRLVAASLSIISKNSLKKHEKLIFEKLLDKSPQVSKAAYSALCKNPPHTDKILPYFNTKNLPEKSSVYLANLLLLQSRWISAKHAISLCRHRSTELRSLGFHWLQDWIYGQRSFWIKPSPTELDSIHLELNQSAPSMDKHLLKELYFFINSYK